MFLWVNLPRQGALWACVASEGVLLSAHVGSLQPCLSALWCGMGLRTAASWGSIYLKGRPQHCGADSFVNVDVQARGRVRRRSIPQRSARLLWRCRRRNQSQRDTWRAYARPGRTAAGNGLGDSSSCPRASQHLMRRMTSPRCVFVCSSCFCNCSLCVAYQSLMAGTLSRYPAKC